MMWTYLSFLVCSVANPTACFVTVPDTLQLAGVSACQMQGMMIAPMWDEQHPGWRVTKIRCSLGNQPKAEDLV